MNEELLKLCQMNLLDECVEEPKIKELLRQKMAKQAKLVIANTPPEEDDD